MEKILAFLFIFWSPLLKGQAISQVKTYGSTASEFANLIFTNDDGEIYIVGAFAGTADFDPGPVNTNTPNITGSHDVYLAKYDSSGNFLWVRTWGAGVAVANLDAYAVINSNNEIIVGFYTPTASLDLDPGPGVVTTFSAAGTVVFVKVDGNGNYVWGKRAASSGVLKGMAIDENDHFYLSGTFQGTADFDPGSGSTTLNSAGASDIFISKYDTSGSFIWVKRIGGTGTESMTDFHMDAKNNLYLAGRFNSNTLDLNPGSGVNNVSHTSNFDSYVCKLDSSGAHKWSGAFGGSGIEFINAIATAGNGDVYLGGSFFGNVDVDMGNGVQLISTPGASDDFFYVKLDSAGVFQYVKVMGGIYNDRVQDIVIDSTNTVYIAGTYDGTVDFDPSPGGVYELISTNVDGFIATYTPAGNFLMVRQIGNGTGGASVKRMFVRNNYVHVCGQYGLFMYVHTINGYTGFSGQGSDVYFFKMEKCATVLTASVSLVPDTIFGCTGDSVTITAVPVNGGVAPNYQWRLNGNSVSGILGPVFTGTVNAGNTLTCVLVSKEGCASNPFTPQIPVVNNLTPLQNPSHFITTSPGIICNGAPVTFGVVATNVGTNPGYQWYQNNVLVPGATNATFSPATYANNDNIACTLFPDGCTSLDSISNNTFMTVFQVPNSNVTVNGNTLTAQTNSAIYQWVDCNANFAPVPNATQQVFTPATNGSYALIISNSFCSDTSACFMITSIGLADNSFEATVQLRPNPADTKTELFIPKELKVHTVLITDITGRICGNNSLSGDEESLLIPLDGWRRGTYFLHLQHDTGVITKVLVVE
jgi:hypothetical protein